MRGFSVQKAKHATHIFQELMAADSFRFDDSPLLGGWYDHNSDGHDEDGLDPSAPDEMALHATWESEGLTFEEILTVGDLCAATIDDDGVIHIARADGDLEVFAFKHTLALKPTAEPAPAMQDPVKAAVLALHEACVAATTSGAFDVMGFDVSAKVVNDFCDAVDEAMVAQGLKVSEDDDYIEEAQPPRPKG